MNIQHAKAAVSATAAAQFPVDALPQIALAGGSSVGKSALINQLGESPKLALISGMPDKVPALTFYKFNNAFYLVDLPSHGYGMGESETAGGGLIETYVDGNTRLTGAILVVDLSKSPKPVDHGFIAWAKGVGLPFVVVASKADKFGHSVQAKHTKRLLGELGVAPADLILHSAHDGQGKDLLLRLMDERLLSRAAPNP